MQIVMNDELQTILREIVQGKTNKEIATELKYSQRTIERRITTLLNLYNVSNRKQLIVEFLLENFA
jgi:DNA-binding NarL/FixJ family response regulator